MENKINVAELLKDCPQGMELDCIICNVPVVFEDVIEDNNPYPIKVVNKDLHLYLTKYGCLYEHEDAKCVIFPKGKTTWEGFQLPFKDGDVVATENGFQIFVCKNDLECYFGWDFITNEIFEEDKWSFSRHATKEEKQKLFDVIKDNGYKWNAETKTLEKLIEPKFKVGNRIKHETHIEQDNVVTEIKDTHYILDDETALPFVFQDEYELVPNKFDISTLKPFDKVLVRDGNKDKWNIDFFSYYRDSDDYQCMTFTKNQCIPYKGNEYLLGKTDDCNEFYKTWEE